MLSSALYAEDLCTTGTLLFREDFGGNSPSDPAVSTAAVSGMSSGYQQIYKLQTNDPGMGMGAGCYLVAKRGYRNSTNTNYSVWHVMDDHTYYGDTTRGYFLEIDGRGSGNDIFYSTVIDGLCEGSRLTFSAYVANLTTAGQYNAWRYNRSYVHPKLSFVLTHPQTGAELARYNTDTIAHDWSLFSTPSSWKYSANWQLVGMNFTVPEGIDSVRLSIRNNATGSATGNDFALDDIEIRLCLTPDTILTDTLVCDTTRYIRWREKTFAVADTLHDTIFNSCGLDSVYYLLSVQTEHCKEPLCLDGILLFREDFGGNNPEDPRVSTTPVPSMSYNQLLDDHFGVMRSGSYLVTKSGYCNGDTSLTNQPQNRRSQWHLQDDHTYPNDRTRGYMLEIDGRGDNAAFYRTTIDHLCEGIELTFSAYVANVMTWGQYVGSPGRYSYPRLIFKLTNPQNNTELATYDTGDIPFDSAFINDYNCWKESSKWNLVGMNFVVPVGVEAIQLSIYNNATGYTGNDFAIDDIEIHLCMTPDTIRTDTIVCDTISQILWRDSLYQIADTLRDTLLSSCGFDSIYYIMKVDTKTCCPDLHYATHDTIVCDTLLPYTWHGLLFDAPGSQTSVKKDERGCDTLQTTWTLNTKTCCPDLHYATRDTIVCDTLLPYTWHGLLFDAPGSQTTIEKDERGCDTLQTTWTLNTKTCCPDLRTITLDTTVCDTLLPYRWRDTLFTEPATYEILYKDVRGCDSVRAILTLRTQTCCPYMIRGTEHYYTCDTLMPYIWHGFGDSAVIAEEGEHIIEIPSKRWPDCIAYRITVILNVEHCEREVLYPIIVNKYNWQLLCNNVRVRELFPQKTVSGYQWFKDNTLIPGATEDDYSEQNELQGAFQLRLTMDNGQYIWSEILTIQTTSNAAPNRIRIYNQSGWLTYQAEGDTSLPPLAKGLYIILIEQNGEQFIEKKLIP